MAINTYICSFFSFVLPRGSGQKPEYKKKKFFEGLTMEDD